jgi:hypothetical protein
MDAASVSRTRTFGRETSPPLSDEEVMRVRVALIEPGALDLEALVLEPGRVAFGGEEPETPSRRDPEDAHGHRLLHAVPERLVARSVLHFLDEQRSAGSELSRRAAQERLLVRRIQQVEDVDEQDRVPGPGSIL